MKKSGTEYNVTLTKRAVIVLLIGIIIYSSNAYALQITEIMFNPQGSDTGSEWIEISFNDSEGCLNLSTYRINEEGTNHNINTYRNRGYCSYAIICNDVDIFLQKYPYMNDSTNALLDEVSIYKSTFSLSNSGENISIRKGNEIIDGIDYETVLDSINVTEGYSLEYIPETSSWRQSEIIGGNPGNMIISGPAENATIENGQDTKNNITKNTTLDDDLDVNISENISSYMPLNVSANTSFEQCNISIKIILRNESQFYEDGTAIKFANRLDVNCTRQIRTSDMNYTIEYWVEDLQGNIIKSRTSTANQDEKSFTPKISERDSILVIRDELKTFEISDEDETENITAGLNQTIVNASASKILLIKDSDYTAPQEKSCPSYTSKSSTSSSSSRSSSGCLAYIPQCSCNQTPITKTVLFCNESMLNKYSKNASSGIYMEGASIIEEKNSRTTSASDHISSYTNTTDISISNAHSQMTGAIIYESPNVKNRFYAVIGLVIVVMACAGVIIYKMNRKDKNTCGKHIS